MDENNIIRKKQNINDMNNEELKSSDDNSEIIVTDLDSDETTSLSQDTISENTDTPDKLPKKHVFLKVTGRIFAFIGVTLIMIVIGLYFIMLVCAKGPSTRVRDIFTLSVRETSAVGFLASWYLSDEEILAIEKANSFIVTDEITDISIVSVNYAPGSSSSADSTFDENTHIVDTNYDVSVYTENGMEFHSIQGSTFTGTMVVVMDPNRVFIGTPRDSYTGEAGLSVPEIADRYGAILATNGGFFVDTNGCGNGGTPIGFVFSEGELKYGGYDTTYSMMGFTNDGVLMCGQMTGSQAISYGIRDGLSCDPFLIINGTKMSVSGAGGLNPRTALGQRADGAVLILTIDGRQATSLGASLSDVADVMLAFGAVNAGNLDGGGSTVLYYNGEIQNVVMSIYGARGVPDAVCVRPE